MPINQGLFTSATDLWETPQDFFDKLNDEFHFTLDVCAIHENAKCEKYYTPEQDGLSQPWTGTCWCNPPYGRQIGAWVRRAWLSSIGGQQLLCYFRRGQIHDGSTNTYTARPRSASFLVG